MNRFLQRYSVAFGLVLMFAFTWPIDLLWAANTRGWSVIQIYQPLTLLVGYGFVVATILATAVVNGKAGVVSLLRRFLIWRVSWIWYAVALFLPLALYLAGMGLQFALTSVPPDFNNVFAKNLFGQDANLWLFLVPFFLINVLINGEEIGWRGYVLPRLQSRRSALVSSLIIGVIWGLWHIPKFLTAGSNQSNTAFGISVLDTVAEAILFTWLFNNTLGSLLLVTLFHAAWNTWSIFLPVDSAVIPILVVDWLVAAAIVFTTGAEHPTRQPSPNTVIEFPSLDDGAEVDLPAN